jgi:hypothetical protein
VPSGPRRACREYPRSPSTRTEAIPSALRDRSLIDPGITRERPRPRKQQAEMLTSEGLEKARSVLTRRLAKPGAVLTSEARATC